MQMKVSTLKKCKRFMMKSSRNLDLLPCREMLNVWVVRIFYFGSWVDNAKIVINLLINKS